jgi:aspartyl-tRNA(Asn)/glutamyl-tRNA(Gln) amidotransferase subunit C
VTAIDPEVVSRIAGLAALELAPEHRERVAAELGAIVSWVDELADLPLARRSEAAGPSLSLRADRVTCSERSSELLSVAPDLDGERFRVPAVLER